MEIDRYKILSKIERYDEHYWNIREVDPSKGIRTTLIKKYGKNITIMQEIKDSKEEANKAFIDKYL